MMTVYRLTLDLTADDAANGVVAINLIQLHSKGDNLTCNQAELKAGNFTSKTELSIELALEKLVLKKHSGTETTAEKPAETTAETTAESTGSNPQKQQLKTTANGETTAETTANGETVSKAPSADATTEAQPMQMVSSKQQQLVSIATTEAQLIQMAKQLQKQWRRFNNANTNANTGEYQ